LLEAFDRDVVPGRANKPTKLSVTAIIPLYNGERFIEQSLRSVLAQTRAPIEILVVDDGSSDGGPALVQRMALDHPTIKLLQKPNGGQSSARNFGVRHSTGQLIALLDQDDAWYPKHIERLIRPFEDKNRPHRLGWVYSNLDEIDRHGNMMVRHFLPMGHHPKTSVYMCLDRDMFVLPSASLISREAFEDIGGFDERLIGYEDDDLFFRLFRAGYNNVYVDEALSMWRIYSSSTSYTSKMSRSRMIYARKLIEQFPDEPENGRYWARDVIAPRFFRNFIGDLFKAARFGHPENVQFACDCLRELLPHMRLKRRILIGAALPLLSNYAALRLMYRTRVLHLGGRLLRYGGRTA
jgi:glycosyltransferase involved in cell wall biosynthesis